jgi:hypothetical protein
MQAAAPKVIARMQRAVGEVMQLIVKPAAPTSASKEAKQAHSKAVKAYEAAAKCAADGMSIERCFADFRLLENFFHADPLARGQGACCKNIPHRRLGAIKRGKKKVEIVKECSVAYAHQMRVALVKKFYVEHNRDEHGGSYERWTTSALDRRIHEMIAAAARDLDALELGGATPSERRSAPVFPFFDVPHAKVCRNCFAAIVCGVLRDNVDSSLRSIGRALKADGDAPAGTTARKGKKNRVAVPMKTIMCAGFILDDLREVAQFSPVANSPTTEEVHVPYATMKQWREALQSKHGHRIATDGKIPRSTFERALAYLKSDRKFNFAVKLSQSKGIATCGKCIQFAYQIKYAQTAQAKEDAVLEWEEHLKQARLQRRAFYRKCQESLRDPNKSWTMHIDGMDQAKTKLPHMCEKSKDHADLTVASCHVVACFCWGGPVAAASYVDLKNVAKDSDHTCTVLMHNLRMQAEVLHTRSQGRPASVPFSFGGISVSHEPPTAPTTVTDEQKDCSAAAKTKDAEEPGAAFDNLAKRVGISADLLDAAKPVDVLSNPSEAELSAGLRFFVPKDSLGMLSLRQSDFFKAMDESEAPSALRYSRHDLREHVEKKMKLQEDALPIDESIETVYSDADSDAEAQREAEAKEYDERYSRALAHAGVSDADARPLSSEEIRRVAPLLNVGAAAAESLVETMELKRQCTAWPEELNLQFDNSGADNKNNFVFALAAFLVKIGLFKRVNVEFMIVGHTHDKADQYFSRVSIYLNTNDARTFTAFAEVLRNAHEKPCKPLVFWVHQTMSFKDWFSGCRWTKLENITRAYSFRFINGGVTRPRAGEDGEERPNITVKFAATALADEPIEETAWRIVMPKLPEHEPMPNPPSRIDDSRTGLLKTVAELSKTAELQRTAAIEWVIMLRKESMRLAGECKECVELQSKASGISISRGGTAAEKRIAQEKTEEKTSTRNDLKEHLLQVPHKRVEDYLLTGWPTITNSINVPVLRPRRTISRPVFRPGENDSAAAHIEYVHTLNAAVLSVPATEVARDDTAREARREDIVRRGEKKGTLVRRGVPGQLVVGTSSELNRQNNKLKRQRLTEAQDIIIELRDSNGLPHKDPDVFFAVLVHDFRYKVLRSTSPLLIAKLAWSRTLTAFKGQTLDIARCAEVPVNLYQRVAPDSDEERKAWAQWNPGAEAMELTAKARVKHGNSALTVSRNDVIVAAMETWRLKKDARVSAQACCAILCRLPDKRTIKNSDKRMSSESARRIHAALVGVAKRAEAAGAGAWIGAEPVIRPAAATSDAAAAPALPNGIELESTELLQQVPVTGDDDADRWTKEQLDELREQQLSESDSKAENDSAPPATPASSAAVASRAERQAKRNAAKDKQAAADCESSEESAMYSASDWEEQADGDSSDSASISEHESGE